VQKSLEERVNLAENFGVDRAQPWRIHLMTAIFLHHGTTFMLPSTTVGTKGF
jgi:hypothetical protein